MKTILFILFCLWITPALCNVQLFNAIDKGNKELVRKILTQNIDINAQNVEGDTALIKAIEKGNEEIVSRILSKGANIEIANNEGITPLIKAAQLNNTALTKLLVGKKANVDAKTANGETALFYFAEKGNRDMVNLLLSKKAEVHVLTENGDSPIHRALHGGHQSILQILLPKIDKTIYGADTKTQLFVAAFTGDEKRVQSLLDSGVEAEQVNAFDETPLVYATKRRHAKIISLLVGYGANGEKLSRELYELFKSGRKDIGMYLVNAGANPSRGGHYGYTPLMAAANNQDIESVRFLLEKGADPNSRDVEGYTAVMFAARQGNPALIETMLTAPRIDINQRNNHGHTALTLAINSKPVKKVIEILLDAGADPVVGNPGGNGDAIGMAQKKRAMEIKKLLEARK